MSEFNLEEWRNSIINMKATKEEVMAIKAIKAEQSDTLKFKRRIYKITDDYCKGLENLLSEMINSMRAR